MPPKQKGRAKTPARPPTIPNVQSEPVSLPVPFTKPQPALEPFLAELSKSHVYITHIDTMPRTFKRKIFAVPVLMNVAVVALLIWRVISIGPFYMKICFSLMGHYNETTMHPENMPWEALGSEVMRRLLTFMVDLVLYSLVWPWPRDFFAGTANGNPTFWRVGIGFRDREIIVRRSRKWDATIGNVLDESSPGQSMLMINVRSAVSPTWMNDRTGYLMMNKEWDLDWKLMLRATTLVNKKTLAIDDFRTATYVHQKEFGWMMIDSVGAGGSAKEDVGRQKVVAFKDKLTAMGKENLFFRWIELIQFESTQPGGFGPEQQTGAVEKAKVLFEEQGVDFEKFWSDIGGLDGMPGMDQS